MNVHPERVQWLMGGNPIQERVNHTTDSESWAGTGNSDWLSVDSQAIGSEGISAPKSYEIGVPTVYLFWKAIRRYAFW